MNKKECKRILINFINCMPKVYRKRNQNWQIVRDILLIGTGESGMISSIKKCRELGIDPYKYSICYESMVV